MDRELRATTDPQWNMPEQNTATLMQFEKGWLWEETLSQAFGQKAAVRIGEIDLDGVIMSPDGYTRDSNCGKVVEEYKCTALSSAKSPADNWRWMMQVKGYCKAVGTLKCIFRILHHMDIMWHPEASYGVWELVFTQGELDENWEAVLNHVKVMKGRSNE